MVVCFSMCDIRGKIWDVSHEKSLGCNPFSSVQLDAKLSWILKWVDFFLNFLMTLGSESLRKVFFNYLSKKVFGCILCAVETYNKNFFLFAQNYFFCTESGKKGLLEESILPNLLLFILFQFSVWLFDNRKSIFISYK